MASLLIEYQYINHRSVSYTHLQGAESEAEFEGYLVKVKAGEPVSLFAFEAESQQAEGRLYVVDTPAEAVYYACLLYTSRCV